MYRCIMADPPWDFDNKLTAMKDGVKRGSGQHYKVLDQPGIEAFLSSPASVIHGTSFLEGAQIFDTIADDAILLLWAPSAHIVNGCAAATAKAWGFTPKQLVTWVKGRLTADLVESPDPEWDTFKPRLVLNVGMGFYTRGCTEHMMVCARGKATSIIQDRGVPNVFIAPRGKHSAKPLEAYRLAERLVQGPRLSIFDRKIVPGWDAIGDQLERREEGSAQPEGSWPVRQADEAAREADAVGSAVTGALGEGHQSQGPPEGA